MTTRTIKVDYLARVEGEGSLKLRIRDGKVEEALLSIFEPPRFFEAFLRARIASEVPDLTARICGICPVAYQMSACHAIEDAAGVKIIGPIRELRRLLYCGEWISSHTLHIYLLHAPDFLGYPDGVTMAKDHREIVAKGLELKKIGNELMRLVGGREIHPINVRVGGFYKAPPLAELKAMAARLDRALEIAKETVRWCASLPFPDYRQTYDFVALKNPDEYPFNEGSVASTLGPEVPTDAYESRYGEFQRKESTALFSMTRDGFPYFVGPMARLAHNFDQLGPEAASLANEVGYVPPFDNPFQSILARGIETVFACEEALRIVNAYTPPDAPFVEVNAAGGTGYGATEAPRGLLYHRYQVGHDGRIETAKIVPPTSQNQGMIEQDLIALAGNLIDAPDAELQHRCEQMIRNYDPCISCATHFLKLDIDRQ